MNYKILLFYKYSNVTDPVKEVRDQKELGLKLGLVGRVLIGYEGINGTIQGQIKEIEKYKKYLDQHAIFKGIVFKETETKYLAFKKLKIKFRPEIVTLGKEVNLKNAAPKISPEQLHESLEKKEELVLVDMRNDYESAIGRFKNSVPSNTRYFRELPEKLETLEKFKDKKIVTYCTGGIRCEKASALLVENGFKEVYQLDGGVFKYAQKYPDGFFEGKCFVFDERFSIDFAQTNKKVLTKCEHCQISSDTYTDCADDTCHRLFIGCENCKAKFKNYCAKDHQLITYPLS